MTVTVKLDPMLEQRLRDHAARSGLTTSDVIRAALAAHLDDRERAERPSAYALGSGLFGKYAGPPDLAERRKQHLADAWADKHGSRRGG